MSRPGIPHLSRGLEVQPIPLRLPNSRFPTLLQFHYICGSHVGGKAQVNVSLDRLWAGDWCGCDSNCLSLDVPWKYSKETKGKFACEGRILKRKFKFEVRTALPTCIQFDFIK